MDPDSVSIAIPTPSLNYQVIRLDPSEKMPLTNETLGLCTHNKPAEYPHEPW